MYTTAATLALFRCVAAGSVKLQRVAAWTAAKPTAPPDVMRLVVQICLQQLRQAVHDPAAAPYVTEVHLLASLPELHGTVAYTSHRVVHCFDLQQI